MRAHIYNANFEVDLEGENEQDIMNQLDVFFVRNPEFQHQAIFAVWDKTQEERDRLDELMYGPKDDEAQGRYTQIREGE